MIIEQTEETPKPKKKRPAVPDNEKFINLLISSQHGMAQHKGGLVLGFQKIKAGTRLKECCLRTLGLELLNPHRPDDRVTCSDCGMMSPPMEYMLER